MCNDYVQLIEKINVNTYYVANAKGTHTEGTASHRILRFFIRYLIKVNLLINNMHANCAMLNGMVRAPI